MKGGRAQASQYAPAWQGSPYNRRTGNRRVALSLAAEVVRAMMGEQQQAPGAKDLWVKAVHGLEDPGGGWGSALQPPRQRGTREIGERTSVRATDEGDGKPWGVLAGIGGVRAVWPPLHGNTALIGLHLSPAGENPMAGGEGAGRKRAKSPWTRGMRACVGNARDVRPGPTVGPYRASLLPDRSHGCPSC